MKEGDFNPTTASLLEKSKKREFWEIFEHPVDQMFLACLLKGMLPVCDIVYDNNKGKFYSYEMPLENVLGTESKADRDTDIHVGSLVLSLIFGDRDHPTRVDDETTNNLRFEANFHVIFDFDMFGEHFWDVTMQEIEDKIEDIYPTESKALEKKLQTLKHFLSGSEGLAFISAIASNLEKIGAGVPEVLQQSGALKGNSPVEAFQKEVLRRINIAEHSLSRKLA